MTKKHEEITVEVMTSQDLILEQEALDFIQEIQTKPKAKNEEDFDDEFEKVGSDYECEFCDFVSEKAETLWKLLAGQRSAEHREFFGRQTGLETGWGSDGIAQPSWQRHGLSCV